MTSKQILEIEAAAKAGKRVQFALEEGDFEDLNQLGVQEMKAGTFDWYARVRRWRIAPEPVKHPLTSADFPPISIIRGKLWADKSAYDIVNGFFTEGVYAGVLGRRHLRRVTYRDLMDDYEYSTDLGKTWKPCWKE